MGGAMTRRIVDLSHLIEHGMITYAGLPGPHICDFWTREASAENYDDGASFQIGRIDMVANTGTYVDAPFHRFADGADLADLTLDRLADLPGLVIRVPSGVAGIGPAVVEGRDVAGHAVLFHTGWDAHWRTDRYPIGHPYLEAETARLLAQRGAALVGIDSYNIDNTGARTRPVHTILLGAGVPICEHLTGLEQLPDRDFRFFAVPPKIRGMGTFPVRAHALL